MTEFQIDVRREPGSDDDGPQGVAVYANGSALTHLLRLRSGVTDDFLLAPPAQLAYWLVDNWWRLRWECIPPDGINADWRLAHDLSSIGAGYPWPRLEIWGEGERVGVFAHSDPPGIGGPVRYLVDAIDFVSAGTYEHAVDRFLEIVADPLNGFGTDRPVLRTHVKALHAERTDREIADWRRLEARLGFDPDEAPANLIETIVDLSERFGKSGVEEAIMAAPGSDSATTLRSEIDAAKGSRVSCDFAAALEVTRGAPPPSERVPWSAAEDVAQRIRAGLGIEAGPLKNKRLSELLGVTKDTLATVRTSTRVAYGLRLRDTTREFRNSVLLRSRWSHDRRFELARALGDAVWCAEDQLGPLARSKTARQKFQRAFSQSLLCPYDDLLSYMNTDAPSDSDITAAAQHFHVAERVVQSLLVNKGNIERHRFDDIVVSDIMEAA